MRSFSFSNSETASKDAMNFAPSFCSAHSTENSIIFVGIAAAMSILFSLLYAFSLINIIIVLITLCIAKLLFLSAQNAKRLFVF